MCLLFFVCVGGIINMKHKQNRRHTKGGHNMNNFDPFEVAEVWIFEEGGEA